MQDREFVSYKANMHRFNMILMCKLQGKTDRIFSVKSTEFFWMCPAFAWMPACVLQISQSIFEPISVKPILFKCWTQVPYRWQWRYPYVIRVVPYQVKSPGTKIFFNNFDWSQISKELTDSAEILSRNSLLMITHI